MESRETTGLDPTDVLNGMLKRLQRQYGHSTFKKHIEIEEPVLVEIANDSDCHRKRIGTMRYKGFSTIVINNKLWLLSVGIKSGSYPGSDIRSDIVAIPCDDTMSENEIKTLFRTKIKMGEYFKNSIFISTSSGYLGTSGNSVFRNEIVEHAYCHLLDDDLLSNRAERDTEYMNLDISPIFTRCATYKPKVIEVFSEAIVSILISQMSIDLHPSPS